MKKWLTFIALVFLTTAGFAQGTWNVDPMHAKLTFATTHLGISDVAGLFKKFDVTVKTNKPDFSDATFELTVDVNSINTEVSMRDDHLKSADFFEVAKYPTMTFKSSTITKTAENRYKLTGNLTLRGISRPVTLDLWYRGTIENPMSKKPTAGFQLTGKLNRSEFGLGNGFPAPMISDEVSIRADGEFVKL